MMTVKTLFHRLRGLMLVSLVMLAGCTSLTSDLWPNKPNGPMARASIHYLIIDVLLMLIVIVPATSLIIWTTLRYRRTRKSTYDPKFTHSNLIEVIVWGGPLAIVCVLSYFSYAGVQAVNPYDPSALKNIPQSARAKPLKINVITTDWQWLFVYPDQDVAVSNELVVPIGRRVDLRLTSASVTNDFYILRIIGQIYIMPGMRTRQHFLVDRPGKYRGFSTEFSGPGFAWMKYTLHAVSSAHFHRWVNHAQHAGQPLPYARFKAFARPTVNVGNRIQAFNHVDPQLFRKVIRNVKSGKLTHEKPMRMSEDMHSALFKRHSS